MPRMQVCSVCCADCTTSTRPLGEVDVLGNALVASVHIRVLALTVNPCVQTCDRAVSTCMT